MRHEKSTPVHRTDYRPPAYAIDRVELTFDLDAATTTVESLLAVRSHTASPRQPLVLDGEGLELLGVEIDGQPAAYERDDGRLVLPQVPQQPFRLRIRTAIAPAKNTALSGLFVSRDCLFTQCEAQGFRRITYFPDRPDVMAVYTVTLRAERRRYPVLLSNGNLVEQGELPGGRHFARWHDPFPKPSYLFALVAGDFACREERIRTASGREVLLQVWVDPGDLPRAEYALRSLQRALRWDEQRFGLELDLDRYMIVASHDFNMGAMENKGLNIFNARYVLADPAVATDADYAHIESVVAHEYFHNWTGNRVTCRDWFQLSLKEGLTVYRDQEFSADMLAAEAGASARAVKRIEDVRTLRASQFPEDAGPMAHPVRPDAYEEIGNFYTATVYEKGAEVVRMLATLVGREGFARGLSLYLRRFDGQAVTCEDFLAAMGAANPQALPPEKREQFARWYAQAGTPRVTVSSRYDPAAQTYELTFVQACPPTPGQPHKEPFLIPIAVGLLDASGQDLPLRLQGEPQAGGTTRVLQLTAPVQRFTFVDVPVPPVPSLARDFSAPVILEYPYTDEQLAFLAAHDSDGFNRWEAGQRLAMARLLAAADAFETERPPFLDELLPQVFGRILQDAQLAPAFKAQALQLPAESFVAESRALIDPEAIRAARQFVQGELGRRLADPFARTYRDLTSAEPYRPDAAAAGRRALRNLALAYLVQAEIDEALALARRQLEEADNITDRQAALAAIVNSRAPFKADILLRLAREWAREPLLMNKWFHVQATAVAHPGEPPVLTRVKALTQHPAYSATNPNNVYALVLAFCAHNPAEFHRPDGSGYAFWVEQVLRLDRINPTVAARVARALERWRKYTPQRQRLMQAALQEVARAEPLSRDVREIVSKALENEPCPASR
ncbi:MAG: aminopeptidase N [Burkholderiaceae bacterium]|nr:aminopeptidase N [Burkholderiaceae bacterium]